MSDRGRRALNIFVACVALIVHAPLMLLVALLIKLESDGPAIFRQPRVGLDRRGRGPDPGRGRRRNDKGGRVFTIYKFRTMRVDGDGGPQQWAKRDDERVTRLGRVLRATRIDELPQLFNVLKGDMNIVGPRPEQPEIFAELRREVGGYEQRQKVLPGITGWAQVQRGYDTSIEDVRQKVALDLEYIRRRSAIRDLLIMIRTLPVMIAGKVWSRGVASEGTLEPVDAEAAEG
jgi:lipopolysaccharide/colanic/teichoic acid biosynthesis glycosyltransferase